MKPTPLVHGTSTQKATDGSTTTTVSTNLLRTQSQQSKTDIQLPARNSLRLMSLTKTSSLVRRLQKMIGFCRKQSNRSTTWLAFHYTHRWKNARRSAAAQSLDLDKETATTKPDSEQAENRFLFHPSIADKLEKSKQSEKSDRLVRIAISNRPSGSYQRPNNQQYRSQQGNNSFSGYSTSRWSDPRRYGQAGFRNSYRPPNSGGNYSNNFNKPSKNQGSFKQSPQGFRRGSGKNHRPKYFLTSGEDQVIDGTNDAAPAHKQTWILGKTYKKPLDYQHSKEWLHDSVYSNPIIKTNQGVQSLRTPLAIYKQHGKRVSRIRDHSGGTGYGHYIRIANIRKRRTIQGPASVRHDSYKQACGKGEFQNGSNKLAKGSDTTGGLHLQSRNKISVPPHTFESKLVKNVSVYPPKRHVRVPFTTLWANNSSASVFKNNEIGDRATEKRRHLSDILHRRHSNHWKVSRRMSGTHRDHSPPPQESRLYIEYGEVSTNSKHQSDFPRISVQHHKNVYQSNSGLFKKDPPGSLEGATSTTYHQASHGPKRSLLSGSCSSRPSINKISRTENGYYKCPAQVPVQLQCPCPLSANTIKDLQWWNSLLSNWDSSPIMLKPVDPNAPVSATTDTSGTGWGITSNFMSIGGGWNKQMKQQFSNYKEAEHFCTPSSYMHHSGKISKFGCRPTT
ncbi:hypothetical protein BB558_006501 [Smittium angustum]|uniref:Uncharacterized protein n=1 Tax=Smittium angustum TaxID=133377 RepID=A0A2U1IXJ0_SMIAN|nr:hypothetical protein BB558_006501 [Smittium angustum]